MRRDLRLDGPPYGGLGHATRGLSQSERTGRWSGRWRTRPGAAGLGTGPAPQRGAGGKACSG